MRRISKQLNELNVSHWCIVPSPWQSSNYSCVTSIPVPIPIWDFSKQCMDNLFFINKPKCLSPLMKGSILCQCYHFINILSHGTCPCSSCFDATIFKELSSKAAKECPTLIRGPIEFGDTPPMSHGRDSTPIVNNGEIMLKASGFCKKTDKSTKIFLVPP